MPIGPIGGPPPIDRTPDSSTAEGTKKNSFEASRKLPLADGSVEVPTAGSIATQLVQDARGARASGKDAALATPLNNLLNAVAAQMGVANLPNEQRQKLIAQLENDPVVRSLIG